MAEGGDSDNLAGRWLVGIFALGIVLIGLQPLKRHSESYYTWLTHDAWNQTKHAVRQLRGLAPVEVAPVKARTVSGETKTQLVVAPSPAVQKDPQKDALNKADREELGKLIDKVATE